MCLFKKRQKRRWQKKLAQLQLEMEKINELCGCTVKDEIATANYLFLNQSGEVSKLLDNGCDPAILESFRTTGILNIPPHVSKENPYGKYSVTSGGVGLIELIINMDALSH